MLLLNHEWAILENLPEQFNLRYLFYFLVLVSKYSASKTKAHWKNDVKTEALFLKCAQ